MKRDFMNAIVLLVFPLIFPAYAQCQSKVKVTGEYTRGLENGYSCWNKVFIAHSKSQSELYLDGVEQEYVENMKYVPSPQMLEESSFDHFPKNTENVYSRNLIWDMMAIEGLPDKILANTKRVLKVYRIQ